MTKSLCDGCVNLVEMKVEDNRTQQTFNRCTCKFKDPSLVDVYHKIVECSHYEPKEKVDE